MVVTRLSTKMRFQELGSAMSFKQNKFTTLLLCAVVISFSSTPSMSEICDLSSAIKMRAEEKGLPVLAAHCKVVSSARPLNIEKMCNACRKPAAISLDLEKWARANTGCFQTNKEKASVARFSHYRRYWEFLIVAVIDPAETIRS
jgi:hypothetical protein